MDASVLAVVAAASGLAGFVQGFAGFGSTLVALPVLGLVLDMRAAAPVACLTALAINVAMTSRLRDHVQRGPLTWLLVFSLPGMAVGVRLLGVASDRTLKTLLGAALLLFVLRWGRRDAPKTAPGKGWMAVAGLLAGALGACLGVNGPPIVAWAARQPWSRDALKATLTSYFLLAGLAIALAQAAGGLVTRETMLLFLASLPALAAGLAAGWACCGSVDEAAFRRGLFGLLAATGVALLWQGAVRA